ncbi:MAG: hypothetical protein ABIH23_22685 [bacterium]
MSADDIASILDQASKGITDYLRDALRLSKIDRQSYNEAIEHTLPNLKSWLKNPHIDSISPLLKKGICDAVRNEKWEDIVNSFHRSTRFGTGGIRAMMAFDRDSIVHLKEQGIGAPVLKGPNTINDLVLLLTSAGVAKFGKSQSESFTKVVIGYDSRVRGYDFASIIAQLFLAYEYTVYIFDEACPYPEVTFAIPHESIKADLGILISASHNDYRYNGFKLSCSNGSQFDPQARDEMYDHFIAKSETKDILLCPYKDAPPNRLFFLGGAEPLGGFDYIGREDCLIDLHKGHRKHVESFLLTHDLKERQKAAPNPLRIGYCAFHGAGRKAVPRLLHEVGFAEENVRAITVDGLNDLNGLFPSFCSAPGHEQQPDPGDPRAARVAVNAFKKQYPGEFDDLDILIGTDPDADRCGVVVKVPKNQQHLYENEDYVLLPADDMWALVVWYRLQKEIETHGSIQDSEKKFIVLSHTTSDSMVKVARKYGLGVIKTWVGFACLAAATRDVWNGEIGDCIHLVEGRDDHHIDLCHEFICECQGMDADGRRSINVAAMEQSNGFSILGGPPPDHRSLGEGGHVRDKDGTFAALLIAELAAWAKERGTSLFELLDREIYLDPNVGLFVNFYEPDPLDGEYPGIEGDRIKKAILRRTLGYYQLALAGDLKIGGRPVRSACIYRTGRYDVIYPPTHDYCFPDEGVRFFFDDEKLSHLTVRPSGTGNSLRFHVQLHAPVTEGDLIAKKEELRARAMSIMDNIRELLKAPRR